ncbi:signal peptidase I [Cohnella phaseoli]|uniref:Signal peptidase I n=1 Tax=Cohnella phaseoli TaxID=456490 RepID=A0A3D9I0M4_9BACL|nr:signal peptidase I [Cohnella phaseoli]RED55201.1 signal peptidase I [Cohnella phaseoli]
MWRLLAIVAAVFLIAGCQNKAIQDPYTLPKLQQVEPAEHQVIVRLLNDAMLGKEVYSLKDLVVDPESYKNGNIQRGDVVYFFYPAEVLSKYPEIELQQELRVVALSGETISMKWGQVFINGDKLDAFYGKDMNNDVKALKKKLKEPDLFDFEKENFNNLIRTVESENLEEQVVPEGMLFLLGDNRMRALDSYFFGPIAEENIIGKVIGYTK